MARTRIKVCGVRTLEAAMAAAEAGADAVGFVFVRASARSIEPEEAWGIIGALPPLVSSVGVFVNASLDAFSDVEEQCPTTLAQLQGNEDVQLVRQCGPGVIKGVRYHPESLEADLAQWGGVEEVDAVLIDCPGGEEFDWPALGARLAGVGKPVILSGGLDAVNVGAAVRAVRPYAVDVSGGVEREHGVKDAALIGAFCRAVQSADRG